MSKEEKIIELLRNKFDEEIKYLSYEELLMLKVGYLIGNTDLYYYNNPKLLDKIRDLKLPEIKKNKTLEDSGTCSECGALSLLNYNEKCDECSRKTNNLNK